MGELSSYPYPGAADLFIYTPSKDEQDYVSEIATQTLSLTLILNFFGTLMEHWNFKYIGKPNQKLKYLNKGSTHTNATFNAIPSGIFYRPRETDVKNKEKRPSEDR